MAIFAAQNRTYMNIDYELRPSHKATLSLGDMADWTAEPTVLNYGAILICRKGSARLQVNFGSYVLREGAVITLFPNDVVRASHVSPDYVTESLRYDASLLREASLQLEHTVYSQLRKDRCRGNSQVVVDIIDAMFSLLKIYFRQSECQCLDSLVLLQLKAFFLGFHDYLQRFPNERPADTGSRRVSELFDKFMNTLEQQYRESRDVSYFASQLSITPKYLNNIVQRVTGHNAKTVINHYAILQLKLTLKSSALTIKEVAWQHHFSDVSFFCRYFKQHTGLTPQQFRRG